MSNKLTVRSYSLHVEVAKLIRGKPKNRKARRKFERQLQRLREKF